MGTRWSSNSPKCDTSAKTLWRLMMGKGTLLKIFLASLLVSVALFERLVFDLGPNVELITLSTFLAGAYLGFPYSFLVPLVALFISDFILGNSLIFLFTWSAYLVIGLSSLILGKWRRNSLKLISASFLGSFSSSIFFFIWTNFGVWFEGWYPATVSGLIQCYLMGLPFLRYNLFSNLVFVPLGFVSVELVRAVLPQLKLRPSESTK